MVSNPIQLSDRHEGVPLDLEDLFEAVDDVKVALGVKLADVAGVEPALVVERLGGGFGVVEVRDGGVVGSLT